MKSEKKTRTGKHQKLAVLEKKIEKQKAALARSREKYEADKEALEALQRAKEELRNQEIIEAISKSGRSYEEIMAYLDGKKKGGVK